MDSYRAFEDAHRGSVGLIRDRLSIYLPLIGEIENRAAGKSALDIGCGRGEWLRLLIDHGWSAQGVDANPSMVEAATAAGLAVAAMDAATYLRGCAASSFALVTAFHVVEHLERDALSDLLAEIERVLAPGGIVILETPNPENLTVASWSFHMDPTHVAPLPPHLLAFLVQSAGLEGAAILRLNGTATTITDGDAPSALLGLFTSGPDFSVIASKPGAGDGVAAAISRFVAANSQPSPADLGRLAAEIGALHAAAQRTDQLAAITHPLGQAAAELKDRFETLSALSQNLADEISALKSDKAQLQAEVGALRRDLAETQDRLRAEREPLTERLTRADQLKAEITGLSRSGDRLHNQLKLGLERLDGRLTAELQAVQQAQHEMHSDFLQLRLRHEQLAALALLKFLTRVRRARRALKARIKAAFAREAPLRTALRRLDRLATRPIRDMRDRMRGGREAARGPAVSPALAPAFPSQSAGERLALQRLTHALACVKNPSVTARPAGSKPRLAFVSPLPPERSGIADYSAQILPELSRHYDIDVVVAQETVSDEWVRTHCAVRSPAWFEAHADAYDRVLYHFGNSPFHIHMFALLEKIPGIVVLHDFYLSDVILHIENFCNQPHLFARSLQTSHGYDSVLELTAVADVRDMLQKYPANFDVLARAQSVIVHNDHARELAARFYPEYDCGSWTTVPLVRYPASTDTKAEARRALGFSDDDVVVCSFGFIHHTKLCDRLLDAWLQSDLVHDERCHLVFVGALPDGPYGEAMRGKIDASGASARIRTTGFVSGDDYHRFLRAADVGVQLRGVSRGETSAAALDCLAYGLATIVNANGAMAELPADCVVQLPDAFALSDLVDALTGLCTDAAKRQTLGARAAEHIAKNHNASLVAQAYRAAIEAAARTAPRLHSLPALAHTAKRMVTANETDAASIGRHADQICREAPLRRPSRRLFVDVTVLAQNDLRTGIQRVVRGLLLELLKAPPPGYRVEPIRLSDVTGQWRFFLARRYTEQVFTGTSDVLLDEPVELAEGDIFLGADFHTGGVVEADRAGLFRDWRRRGVRISFIVYDILPLTLPHCFPPHSGPGHLQWILVLSEIADDLVCISASVAAETAGWLETHAAHARRLPAVHAWALGADIEASHPTLGMPEDAEAFLATMQASDCFLMVGTLEPRKGHLQVLKAFELLWARGSSAKLVVVGNEGWRDVPREHARTLPELMDRLRPHPELGRRLFWIQGASDEFLDRIYQEADCLIAASLDEGFGLPLIEAARHGIPIIARDIPVFREVAGDHAAFFSGHDDAALAQAIEDWLVAFRADRHPKSAQMPWLTWAESAARLTGILLDACAEDRDATDDDLRAARPIKPRFDT